MTTDKPELDQDDSATILSKYYKQLVGSTSLRRHLSVLPPDITDVADNKNLGLSKKVLERLLLRHAILQEMERIESKYDANINFVPDRSKQDAPEPPNPYGIKRPSSAARQLSQEEIEAAKSLRACRLATTDLFVEKAIAYLEDDYKRYLDSGEKYFRWGIAPIIFGIFVSLVAISPILRQAILGLFGIAPDHTPNAWIPFTTATSAEPWHHLASNFISSFTFYGFLVILLVYCLRVGRAMIGQAERLRERRHSLRQGRLFIHLRDGEVSAEELLSAFDWNLSKGNAFEKIPTEASAPWGAVIKEAIKAIPDAVHKLRSSDK